MKIYTQVEAREFKASSDSFYDALKLIADGTEHAQEIAKKALGWPDNAEQHIELLREENLKLKLQIEESKKRALDDIFKKMKDSQDAPREHQSISCFRCGVDVRFCICKNDPTNPFGYPKIWCRNTQMNLNNIYDKTILG